jgi:hypothetical protein
MGWVFEPVLVLGIGGSWWGLDCAAVVEVEMLVKLLHTGINAKYEGFLLG